MTDMIYLVAVSSNILHLKGKYLADKFNWKNGPLLDYIRGSLYSTPIHMYH